MKNTFKVISIITDPKLTFSLFSLVFMLNIVNISNFHLLILVFCIIFFCLISIHISHRNNSFDNFKFKNREVKITRAIVLIFSLLYSLLLLLISIEYKSKQGNFIFGLYFFLNCFFLTLTYILNFKFSAHIGFNGIIFLLIPGSWKYLIFLIFTLIVGKSRLVLKKHNTRQVVITFILLICIYLISDLYVF